MGIYDREYYRQPSGGFERWMPGQVCKYLIITNVIVYFIQMATRRHAVIGWDSGPFTSMLEMNTGMVLHGQVWRLLTYAFLHSADWQHIVFNMLALWMFGKSVEDIYGPREFLAFYLVAAFLGGVGYMCFELIAHPGIYVPMLGASGAVTACIILFAMHFPKATVYLFFVLPVPVIVLAALFVIQDTLGLLGNSSQPIAFATHLSGALFGFLYYKLHWRMMNFWPSRMSFRPGKVRPKLKVFKEPLTSDTAEEAALSSDVNEHLEAQVDAVLDKVARLGKSSLTEREQQILMKASEVYKQRRK